jgi:hypothetical protein
VRRKKSRSDRFAEIARRERLAALKSQMEEVGIMFDGFMRNNSLMSRLVRDNYAGRSAAASCWASDGRKGYWTPKKIAQRAFDVADAMMAERKKRSK